MSGFDVDVVLFNLPYLFLNGMRFTLTLTVLASVGGIVLGTGITLLRLAGHPVVGVLAATYVNVIRAMPLVLVIFWFYFLVPYLGQWLVGASRPIQVGALPSALITFVVFEAAYFSEIMRAGIASIAHGQVAAALALGMTGSQAMRDVILPQVFRKMLPILLTQTIVLFQDTSLVYVLSLTDFLGAASKIAQRDGRLVEMYVFAAIVYFAFSFAFSQSVRRLQSRMAIPR